MRITVLIATRDRPAWLERSLDSVVRAARACPAVAVSIRVQIAGPDLESEQIAKAFVARCRDVPVQVQTSAVSLSPGAARNAFLPVTATDWVFCLDDDAFVPEDFFSRSSGVLTALNEYGISVAGGPNLTPPRAALFSTATGAVLGSRLACWFSSQRYKPRPRMLGCGEESLILCNLFFRPGCLPSRAFREEMPCGEENVLLSRLKRTGTRMAYDPELWVWHERRPDVAALSRQIFRYGRVRGESIRNRRVPARWAHFVPSLFLLLVASTSLMGAHSPDASFGLWVLSSYALSCVVGAVVAALDARNMGAVFVCALLFPVVHGSYGAGFLAGWFGRGVTSGER